MPRRGQIDPRTVRYTQDSISYYFQDGGNLDDLVAKLKAGTTTAADVEPIRLVPWYGDIYSLDNRRLWAFKKAGVPIRYLRLDYTPENQEFKITTTNEGKGIKVRK